MYACLLQTHSSRDPMCRNLDYCWCKFQRIEDQLTEYSRSTKRYQVPSTIPGNLEHSCELLEIFGVYLPVHLP